MEGAEGEGSIRKDDLNERKLDEIARFLMCDPRILDLDLGSEDQIRGEVEEAVEAVFIRSGGSILPEPLRRRYIDAALEQLRSRRIVVEPPHGPGPTFARRSEDRAEERLQAKLRQGAAENETFQSHRQQGE